MENSVLLASFAQKNFPGIGRSPMYRKQIEYVHSSILYLAYAVFDILFFIKIKHILELQMQ